MCFVFIYLWFFHVSGVFAQSSFIESAQTNAMKRISYLARERKMCVGHVPGQLSYTIPSWMLASWHCALLILVSRTLFLSCCPRNVISENISRNRTTNSERDKIPMICNLLENQSSSTQPPPVFWSADKGRFYVFTEITEHEVKHVKGNVISALPTKILCPGRSKDGLYSNPTGLCDHVYVGLI